MDSDEFFNIDVKKVITFLKTRTISKNKFTINKITKKRHTNVVTGVK